MQRETKTVCELLYRDICFIVVVWNPDCDISEVGLYYYYPPFAEEKVAQRG